MTPQDEYKEVADMLQQDANMTRNAAEALAMELVARRYGEAGVLVMLDAA
jgi:hypothetical protein